MSDPRVFTHVLFDLDRTLAYYPVSTADIVTRVVSELGLDARAWGPAEAVAADYDAWWARLERTIPSVDALRHAAWQHVLAERGAASEDLVDSVASRYSALRSAHGVRLYDGALDLLRDLRAHGLGLGLLTNGSSLQWEKIRSLGIGPRFDAIAVAGDADLYKPDPQAFLALLARLGARARSSLFVGDSYELDVVGADAAGLFTAWVRPDGTPAPNGVQPTYAFASVLAVREVVL